MIDDTPLAVWPSELIPSLQAMGRAPRPSVQPRINAGQLRNEEWMALRLLNTEGPMSVYNFHRRCKLPKGVRREVLLDLDRLGFIESYYHDAQQYVRAIAGRDLDSTEQEPLYWVW